MAISKIENNSLASGVPSTAKLPAGTVLQVVQGTSTATVVTSSTSYTDTGLSATITPTSASSKILVLVQQEVYIYGGGNDSGGLINIVRNGTAILSPTALSLYTNNSAGGAELIVNLPLVFLDSPATASAIVYKTQSAANSGATVMTGYASNLSTITLMEIAA